MRLWEHSSLKMTKNEGYWFFHPPGFYETKPPLNPIPFHWFFLGIPMGHSNHNHKGFGFNEPTPRFFLAHKWWKGSGKKKTQFHQERWSWSVNSQHLWLNITFHDPARESLACFWVSWFCPLSKDDSLVTPVFASFRLKTRLRMRASRPFSGLFTILAEGNPRVLPQF